MGAPCLEYPVLSAVKTQMQPSHRWSIEYNGGFTIQHSDEQARSILAHLLSLSYASAVTDTPVTEDETPEPAVNPTPVPEPLADQAEPEDDEKEPEPAEQPAL